MKLLSVVTPPSIYQYITGAYLRADMDDEVHVVFRAMLKEMTVATNLALYWPFVSYETVKAALYVWLQKVLYGFLKSALFFLR